jgi:molecular chaperone HtpG
LARFESSKLPPCDLRSFKEYVADLKDNQTEIYYSAGDNRTNLERNPNLEYFKKNDIEVLFLTHPVDVFVVPSLMEYDGKPIKSIEKADINIDSKDDDKDDDNQLSKSLLNEFKTVLGDKVEDVVVSKRLVDSAVTLVAGKDAMDPQMERMMRMVNKDASESAKKILEVNMDHPLMRNLSQKFMANNADPMIKECVVQLYESALLVEGDLSSPGDFVKRLNDIMVKATQ